MSDEVEDHAAFMSAYEGRWERLRLLATKKVGEELSMLGPNNPQNLYRAGDLFDGLGRLDMLMDEFDAVDLFLRGFVESCCFPNLDCADIDEAIGTIGDNRDSIFIERDVGRIHVGLDTWNTEDRTDLNEGGVLGVTEGPAELFKKYYADTVNPTLVRQDRLMGDAIESLKAWKTLVTENRLVPLTLLDDVMKTLREYEPLEGLVSATIHMAFTVVGLVAGSVTVGAGAVASDLIATKVMEELEYADAGCAVEVLHELRNTAMYLTTERVEVITDFTANLEDMTDQVNDSAHEYVCKRPSQLDDTGPTVYV
ncbi:hypothetical protein LX16_4503 [Stackebrandtia albiflava]|uniref:Uncharacterized protein n=1 Tax=Stackebrandtia albiflava TaxID=406432 RepID=A0A562URQ3_9ACTN|nr:hypothetical protein [Stackebrandtia albiflava]TWJ08278.1 hypothetical protein LX16_4503 [Stackebrandtia albiflava]